MTARNFVVITRRGRTVVATFFYGRQPARRAKGSLGQIRQIIAAYRDMARGGRLDEFLRKAVSP